MLNMDLMKCKLFLAIPPEGATLEELQGIFVSRLPDDVKDMERLFSKERSYICSKKKMAESSLMACTFEEMPTTILWKAEPSTTVTFLKLVVMDHRGQGMIGRERKQQESSVNTHNYSFLQDVCTSPDKNL